MKLYHKPHFKIRPTMSLSWELVKQGWHWLLVRTSLSWKQIKQWTRPENHMALCPDRFTYKTEMNSLGIKGKKFFN
jgi:hypothetical protein